MIKILTNSCTKSVDGGATLPFWRDGDMEDPQRPNYLIISCLDHLSIKKLSYWLPDKDFGDGGANLPLSKDGGTGKLTKTKVFDILVPRSSI